MVLVFPPNSLTLSGGRRGRRRKRRKIVVYLYECP